MSRHTLADDHRAPLEGAMRAILDALTAATTERAEARDLDGLRKVAALASAHGSCLSLWHELTGFHASPRLLAQTFALSELTLIIAETVGEAPALVEGAGA